MNLKVLYTKRKYDNRFFFDLVYEWEDVLMSELGLRAYHYDEAWSKWGGYKCLQNGFLRRLIKRFRFAKWLFLPAALGLKLDMWTELSTRYNSNNIIPWIIDFFLEPKDFSRFNEAYKHYPLVFIKRIPLSPRYIAHRYNRFTYPIQQKDTREMIASLKQKLSAQGFYMTGRFADWEYYNMDVAMAAAMKTVNEIVCCTRERDSA